MAAGTACPLAKKLYTKNASAAAELIHMKAPGIIIQP
mgnify:CR=1 FL=1